MRLFGIPSLSPQFFLLAFLPLFFSLDVKGQYAPASNMIAYSARVYTGYRCPFKLRFVIRSGEGRFSLALKPVFQKYREVLAVFSKDGVQGSPLTFSSEKLNINYKYSGLADRVTLPAPVAHQPDIQFAYNPAALTPEFKIMLISE
jgi:hypothetical protein